MSWFKPLEDLKFDDGVIGFSKRKTYAIQYESKNHYLVSVKPNNINCNQCCRFRKKDEGVVFELVDVQYT